MKLTKTNRKIKSFETLLLKLIEAGVPVNDAVRQAYKKHPVMNIAKDEIEKLMYEAAKEGLGKPIQEELYFNFDQSWTPDMLTLSERTTQGNIAVQMMVAKTVDNAVKSVRTAYRTAESIFKGYNEGGIIPTAQMPKYIDEIVSLATKKGINTKAFQKVVRKTSRNINNLTTSGLRAAYQDIMKAFNAGAEEKVKKAVYVATQEKTRYYAMRIARTEIRRAYLEGQLAKHEHDPEIIGYKWCLSSRHPCYDICDVYASADLYGMGKGIFPKGKVPFMPVHPNCMCKLKPVVTGSIDNEVPDEQIEAGGRAYLDSVTEHKRKRILGIKGDKAYKEGDEWTKYARGYTERPFGSRITVGKNGEILYNKCIEHNGRQAIVKLRPDGTLVPDEIYDINTFFKIDAVYKQNCVVLNQSISKKGTYRQENIIIYGSDSKMLLQLHYGHHGNPSKHNFGMKDSPEYRHKHFVSFNEAGCMLVEDGEAMSNQERRYIRREDNKG